MKAPPVLSNAKTLLAIGLCWYAAMLFDSYVDQARDNPLMSKALNPVILDSMPNFLAGFLIPLPLMHLYKDSRSFLPCYGAGVIIYEMLQCGVVVGVFDPADIVATTLGVGLCGLCCRKRVTDSN